ncbi:MAG: hypothetical protein OQL09_06790 [Gammaproteobacteria bacterium]|nr:hypothetical protein [Gammaproteobacteria bacterium]
MKKLSADLKRMLSALAFADAGEHLSRTSKMEILKPSTVKTTHTPVYTVVKAQQNPKPKTQVAILFDGHASNAVLDYLQNMPYALHAEINILSHGRDSDLAVKTEQLSQQLHKIGRKSTITYLNNEASDVFQDYCNNNPELRYMIAPKDDLLAREVIDNPDFHSHSKSVPLILIQDSNRTSVDVISAA